ncbi:hypothetical protein VTK73DRAFT_1896 [Phialemonium thermophilum]|uniref:Uncharacterized protein n=1 Tax=Phialemonium thermophilum TaxID=223376 RepID=A0ABR3Y382_9PEZI
MVSEAAAETGVPNLNLTPEEKRVYGQLFRQADTESVGVVTGEVAVKFFEKTRLDSRILGEIWQIADKENRGFLTPAGFGIALRLIGHAQAGREPTPELALQHGPLPRFDGFTPAVPVPAPIAPPPAAALQAQGTGGSGPIRIPPLTPEKVAQYAALFERQNLQSGNLLPGDQAKQIFEKSGLPNEILGRIWMLADTEQRGALVLTEFVIAMHLLTSMKSGALRALPTILPAPLYEAATRRAPTAGSPRQQTPTSPVHGISAIPRQLSGQAPLAQMRTGSPLARPPIALAPQSTGDWLITPADKARFDQLYAELDKANKGFITGEEAVPFFSQSDLSEETLAQIWDLADINSEGRLTRDEFAVAMYLIRQQRTKRDSILPATLPPNLVPPSMRNRVRPPTIASPTTFDAAAPPAVAPAPPQPRPSALDDLFGLDSTPAPAPAPAAPVQVPVGTGGSGANDPFASSLSPPAPSSPIRASPTGTPFKPFVPSSSFGRGLVPQTSGGSSASTAAVPKPAPPPPPPQAAAVEDDLLGDNDPEVSKNLTNETTELANLSNQVGSLSKQMQDVQAHRTATQNELNQASVQKKNFEQRLAQLRAAYEKEARDVRALEQQLATSRNETKKIQTDLALLEATYQDLQNQHRQVLTALQADQQENTNLKERIRAVNAEIAQLKPQIEKLKSEARQQKGLVAINKKQLATNEGERDKLKTEVEDLTRSNEELARQISASSSQPPTQTTSPVLSMTTANNPFFRRTGSTDIIGSFASPSSSKAFNDKSFDDVFGPSVPPSTSQASTPPAPPVLPSFKPQTTGTSTGSVGYFATPGTSSPNVSRQSTLSVEPPPAPESRQLSSSNLPLGEPAESLSSSRQVSPPASRLGFNETPATEPQTNPLASAVEAFKTGQSVASASGSEAVAPKEEQAASPAEARPATDAGSASSLFGATQGNNNNNNNNKTDEAKAKEDFESAFASFKNAKAKSGSGSGEPAGSEADVNKAFSNFNTEFPPISELERDDESDSESERGGFDDDFAPASPPSKGNEKESGAAGSKPPSPTVPKAAPTEAATTSATTADAPSVSDPPKQSDFPSPPAQGPTAPAEQNTRSHDIFGPSDSGPFSSATAPTTDSTSAKGAFDDLDDDFEGLEDAKEGSADDDFANISRSGLEDYNPVFDSSPPASQAAKSDSANTNAQFGTESSFDFASLSTASAAGSATLQSAPSGSTQQQQPSKTTPNPPDSHDWDAIFASLDEAPPAATTTTTTSNGAAVKEPTKEQPARPSAPGRALTEAGEHDDPILKNLTSMGYSRADALSALEKYDYNLERAANYLASQS